MTLKFLKTSLPLVSKDRLVNFSKFILLFTVLAISSSIALFTKENIHPDEHMHLDAFHYFEGRLWPPDVGSDLVQYSDHGVSRVYKGELVYLIYGNLAYLLKNIFHLDINYITYRFFNVILFICMISMLLFAKNLPLRLQRIGLVILAIPQVCYLFSYANSDAWSLFSGVLIFLFTLRRMSTPLPAWKMKDLIWLGILTGLVAVSKNNFRICLIFPCVCIAYGIIINRSQIHEIPFRKWLVIFSLCAATFMVVFAPLRLIYPLTQENYKTRLREVQREKAAEGFRQNDPASPWLHMNEKGFNYYRLIREKGWLNKTFKTFWGGYSYMNSWSPRWLYIFVVLSAVLLWIMTLISLFKDRSEEKSLSLLFLMVSLCVCVLNVWASLYYSLYIDFQPQGRYLFPALIPLSILLLGTFKSENPYFQRIRFIIFVMVFMGGQYSLISRALIALS